MIRLDGQRVGTVMQIQDQGESIEEATIGKEVAVSMKEPTIGRQFDEGDILYVAVPEEDVQMLLTKYQTALSKDDLEVLKELIEVMRKISPSWGPLMIMG